MPDPDEVRTALARLATGDVRATGDARPTDGPGGPFPGGPEATAVGRGSEDAPPREAGTPSRGAATGDATVSSSGALAGRTLPPADAVAVVDVAAEAVADLDAAAVFAAAGGVPLLERAVEAADARDDVAVARRGQRALAAFRWVRRAARGGDADRTALDDPTDDDNTDAKDAGDTDTDLTDGDDTDADETDNTDPTDTDDTDATEADNSVPVTGAGDTDRSDANDTDSDEPTTSAPVTESI